MNPDDLVERVRAYIAKHQLLAPGERVLVAVSGGVDSMVLLHLLRILAYDVRVAHFDHQTRGDESARDAAHVVAHCAEIGVPCDVGIWDSWPGVEGYGSLEMQARKARYEFLAHTAKRRGCKAIVTGHHADDQAETVLFRILRGTGPEGLAAIPPSRRLTGIRITKQMLLLVSGGGDDLNLRLVRPLLDIKHTEIEAFAREVAIDWCVDATNADTSYQRNWVRHVLLPKITGELNPKAVDALNHLADSMRCENQLLDALMHEAMPQVVTDGYIQREKFRALHEALQRRILRHWLSPGGAANSFELVVAAVEFVRNAPPGNRMSLDKERDLFASQDKVHLYHHAREGETAQLDVPGECVFEGQRFTLTLSDTAPAIPLKAFCNKQRQVFDADALGEAVAIFAGATANEFLPLGATRPKKLNEYLKDRQVPLPERLLTPIILAKDGVAWVVGHAPSALFAVTPETKRFAIIEVLPCD